MAEGEEPKAPPKSRKLLFPILIFVGVVVFTALAVGVFLLLRSSGGPEVFADPDSGPGPVEIAFQFPPGDPLKVQTNLAGGRTVINAEIWLKLNVDRAPKERKERDRKRRLEAELAGKIPEIQEAVTEVFNTTTVETLESLSARDGLKDKLRTRINRLLVHGEVQDVVMMQITQPLD